MGGHVNMMDDVLIANLPPEYLRSALRLLVAQGATVSQPFVHHVRKRLQNDPPALVEPLMLFPGSDIKSHECDNYLSRLRCLFASKLAFDSIPYFTHFINSVAASRVSWTSGSPLDNVFEQFGGDVVQAVQALKEIDVEKMSELKQRLENLLQSFNACQEYCTTSSLPYPFTRPERQVGDVLQLFFPTETIDYNYSTAEEEIQLTLPQDSSVETFTLGRHQLPRIFNGLWQLASPAWGAASSGLQQNALIRLAETGFTAADMAEHYGDAELIYGAFRNKLPLETREKIYAATKWCIFKPLRTKVTREWVLQGVKERHRRLGGTVDLLQFHWYDYNDKAYLEILTRLVEITQSHPSLVSAIGLCNFDAHHTEEVCEHLQTQLGQHGVVSNQVQFSPVDTRPLKEMVQVCGKYGLKLLTYGSFCGGFLAEAWIGKPVPEPYSDSEPMTPSQRKYLDMITTWGSWSDFQLLLNTLQQVATKQDVSLANVATRWILQQKSVGAVIAGTRLGVSDRSADNARSFGWELSGDDIKAIDDVAIGLNGERLNAVFDKLGDCGNEYRAMH